MKIDILKNINSYANKLSSHYYYWKLAMAYWEMYELSAYLQCMSLSSEDQILDLGCGDGTFGEMMYKLHTTPENIIGLDINKKSIEIASQRNNVYGNVLCSSAEDMPFSDNRFDLVYSNQVLHCIDGRLSYVLSEASRVLRQNGSFYCTLMTDNSINNLYLPGILRRNGLDGISDILVRSMIRRIPFRVRLDSEKWVNIINNNGFEIRRIVPFMYGIRFKVWSVLMLLPFRMVGILRYLRFKKLWRRISYLLISGIESAQDDMSLEDWRSADSILVKAIKVE